MMNKGKNIWEEEGFRKNPYKVPESYFAGFPDRMMQRLSLAASDEPVKRGKILRPWMAWASGIAAILAIGWFGIRTYYWKPLQEARFQERIALFVDFYGEELHEGSIAEFITDNNIVMSEQVQVNVDELVQTEPDLAEEYVYESLGL
jgi:hypothetical protein